MSVIGRIGSERLCYKEASCDRRSKKIFCMFYQQKEGLSGVLMQYKMLLYAIIEEIIQTLNTSTSSDVGQTKEMIGIYSFPKPNKQNWV